MFVAFMPKHMVFWMSVGLVDLKLTSNFISIWFRIDLEKDLVLEKKSSSSILAQP